WFLLLITLLLPYIPTKLLNFGNIFTGNGNSETVSSNSTIESPGLSDNENWMHDFSISVDRIDLTVINNVLTIIWILGMLFIIAFYIHVLVKLRHIKNFIR